VADRASGYCLQHYTCATDTKALSFVLSAVNDVIIQSNLRDCESPDGQLHLNVTKFSDHVIFLSIQAVSSSVLCPVPLSPLHCTHNSCPPYALFSGPFFRHVSCLYIILLFRPFVVLYHLVPRLPTLRPVLCKTRLYEQKDPPVQS
jgi:hypothetical protein